MIVYSKRWNPNSAGGFSLVLTSFIVQERVAPPVLPRIAPDIELTLWPTTSRALPESKSGKELCEPPAVNSTTQAAFLHLAVPSSRLRLPCCLLGAPFAGRPFRGLLRGGTKVPKAEEIPLATPCRTDFSQSVPCPRVLALPAHLSRTMNDIPSVAAKLAGTSPALASMLRSERALCRRSDVVKPAGIKSAVIAVTVGCSLGKLGNKLWAEGHGSSCSCSDGAGRCPERGTMYEGQTT